jgi:hypothetical protein
MSIRLQSSVGESGEFRVGLIIPLAVYSSPARLTVTILVLVRISDRWLVTVEDRVAEVRPNPLHTPPTFHGAPQSPVGRGSDPERSEWVDGGAAHHHLPRTAGGRSPLG